jgi:hypothetical protein
VVQSQLGEIVPIFLRVPISKTPFTKKKKKKAGGVAPGVGSEFKPQYCKTKQKKTKDNSLLSTY